MTTKTDAEALETLIDPNFFAATTEEVFEKPCQEMEILDDVEQKSLVELPNAKQDSYDDYAYARQVHINVIKQTEQAVGATLEMTQAAPNPRGFEVAGQLLKLMSDSADKLMKLQKEFKEVSAESRPSGTSQEADTINNTNIVFNGTPEELMDMLDQQAEVLEEQ